MSEKFYNFFIHACGESCCAALIQKRKESEEYQEAHQTYSKLFDEIKEKLGQDSDLIFQLDETVNHCGSLDQNWLYQQCFRDCFFLLKWMGAFA